MQSQVSSRQFPAIETVFNETLDSSRSLLYQTSIRAALSRLFSPDFFDSYDNALEDFLKELPVLQWVEHHESSGHLSISLVCRHRVNAVKFFYEMITRWLLPGRRLLMPTFFAADFKLPEWSNELFTFCEIAISLEHLSQWDMVRQTLPVLESEIRLGLVSVYHAHRMLEIKGLSGDEKTTLIQERLLSFLKRRPEDFDDEIFRLMQHFLVMCGAEFKSAREYRQMSRIVYVFYLFQRKIALQIDEDPQERHVYLKFSKVTLQLPFGSKRSLGVIMGINFLNENEVFEKRHLMEGLKLYLPEVCEVEGSYLTHPVNESGIQLLYLEVEKGGGGEFSMDEIRRLKEQLPQDLKAGVEKLTRPLFMPRNEEEVMRNIITLSQQLKFPKDLPQVIISFEGQADEELSFTIILLRLLNPAEQLISIEEMFQKNETILRFCVDRIKSVGMLRKKYSKEATVFRVKLSTMSFLRGDHSVDLLKARLFVRTELQRIVGEVRDFNGGMIAKQEEQLIALKSLCSGLGKKEEALLENYFHSIYPIEMRSFVSPDRLKTLFYMLLDAVDNKREAICILKEDVKAVYLLNFDGLPEFKEKIAEGAASLRIPASQLVRMSLQVFDFVYEGVIFQSEDLAARSEWIKWVST